MIIKSQNLKNPVSIACKRQTCIALISTQVNARTNYTSLVLNLCTCRCWRCNDICAYFSCHFLQRGKLFFVDQIELSDKIVEMLVAGVDMRLSSNTHDPVEMMHVHVYKHAVQTCQNLLTLRLETFRKGNVCSDWKQLKILIIDLMQYCNIDYL